MEPNFYLVTGEFTPCEPKACTVINSELSERTAGTLCYVSVEPPFEKKNPSGKKEELNKVLLLNRSKNKGFNFKIDSNIWVDVYELLKPENLNLGMLDIQKGDMRKIDRGSLVATKNQGWELNEKMVPGIRKRIEGIKPDDQNKKKETDRNQEKFQFPSET